MLTFPSNYCYNQLRGFMKISQVEKKVTTKSSKIKEMSADTDKLIDLFYSKLYSTPIKTSTKEYIANAIDACIEAKNPIESIEIQSPTPLMPYLSIRDFGNGMSKKFFENDFMRAGTSTKTSDNEQNGGFGVGSKSWFSTGNDEIIYETYSNGTKNSYLIFKQNGKYNMLHQKEEKTSEKNGVLVKLSAKKDQFEEITQAINENLFYLPNKLLVNGSPSNNYKDRLVMENDDFILYDNNYNIDHDHLQVRIGYFVYPILSNKKTNFIDNDDNYKNCLIFKKNIGELTIAPNRESLVEDLQFKNFTKSLKRIVDENQKNIDFNVSQYIQSLLNKVTK